LRACFGSLVLSILSRWLIELCLCLDFTSCISEISSSFLITSLFILSSLVYPLTFKNRASYIYRTGVPLPSRCCISYIFFSKKISTEFFKHAAHSPFFSSKCHLFQDATFFGSCIIHISHTSCAKI